MARTRAIGWTCLLVTAVVVAAAALGGCSASRSSTRVPSRTLISLPAQDNWFTHDAGESLIAAARAPKKLVWYDAGHGLDSDAYSDRIGWLASALGRP